MSAVSRVFLQQYGKDIDALLQAYGMQAGTFYVDKQTAHPLRAAECTACISPSAASQNAATIGRQL